MSVAVIVYPRPRLEARRHHCLRGMEEEAATTRGEERCAPIAIKQPVSFDDALGMLKAKCPKDRMSQNPQTRSIAIAIMHRHNVLPSVLIKLVEMMPIPNPSPRIVTAIQTTDRTPRNIKIDGLRNRNFVNIVRSIILFLCCPAFERDDSAWPELNKQDDENDHIGLSRKRI